MYLLVLDTETTGLVKESTSLIEVACALFCTNTKSTLASLQFVIPSCIHNEASEINGITDEELESAKELYKDNELWETFDSTFRSMMQRCDYVVAHNIKFDKYFIDKRYSDTGKQWICTYADIQFPKTRRSLCLTHIAVDHGIIPTNVHRALGDVITLVELLKVVPNLENQIQKVIKLRTSGRYFIVDTAALGDAKNNNDLKEKGFKWNFDLKAWGKWMLPEDAKTSGIPVAETLYR